uniref:Uncharacterized protein n=1 Tax=Mus musculus TaxID=10090 RepID=Q3UVF0_MOUSE|nr:unnamed protein product [Mus musculus]
MPASVGSFFPLPDFNVVLGNSCKAVLMNKRYWVCLGLFVCLFNSRPQREGGHGPLLELTMTDSLIRVSEVANSEFAPRLCSLMACWQPPQGHSLPPCPSD